MTNYLLVFKRKIPDMPLSLRIWGRLFWNPSRQCDDITFCLISNNTSQYLNNSLYHPVGFDCEMKMNENEKFPKYNRNSKKQQIYCFWHDKNDLKFFYLDHLII